ncbi:hypothetical protein HPB50_009962 [Hyalomma asiaticum]|uniref:Uncharacterized protein n=1 Tax=Hyalomma asiaticum TaxID=266040 RepID=A0ACB7S2I3_HYAAI|nr:hypothetical protein HPB50_009962 [Hyalomma asiaticum]
MDILGALAFMDETLNWAVLFDFERVPRHETPCLRTSSSKSRKLSSTGGVDDYVVRVKVASHFLPLQRLVADMVAHDRFDAYLELLFVTLVNQDLKPVPSANRTKSIEIDVTDLFLGDFVGANWRLSDARTVRLLSRNRIALSLLRHAVDVVSAWSTFYPERHSFIEIWKWASRNRVSEVFVPKRSESNASCCVREGGASALVPASSIEAGMCCGLFDELVATADWTALRWEDIDDHKDKESRPYVVQPFAWNVPFFAPGLDLPLKYGALGSLLASLVAANYYEFGDNLEYEMLVKTFAACLNATEMSLVSNRTWSASSGAVARILALRNASLESLWKAYRAAWEYLSGHGVSPSGFADVESDRLTDDRLFFVSWCLAVCGELGSRELCNVPLQSGDTFASRNFTSVFRCEPREPMSLPAKCAKS